MTDETPTLSAIYDGWHHYQDTLVQALAPLTAEQLALRAAPRLRSVGEVAAHVIGARARWFQQVMGEGGDEFAALGRWDIPNAPARSAAELIQGAAGSRSGRTSRWSRAHCTCPAAVCPSTPSRSCTSMPTATC